MSNSSRAHSNICARRRPLVHLPCLRKDFIVDEFQIVEARAHSADAVLLIVAALSQNELVRLAREARQSHGLDALCEAHDERELQRAVDAGCNLIGINSRDLRTFKVSLDTALRTRAKNSSGMSLALPRVESSRAQTWHG